MKLNERHGFGGPLEEACLAGRVSSNRATSSRVMSVRLAVEHKNAIRASRSIRSAPLESMASTDSVTAAAADAEDLCMVDASRF